MSVKKKKIWIIFVVLAIIVVGVLVVIFLMNSSKNQSSNQAATLTGGQSRSSIPWTMFYGNYYHTGFADVVGPSQTNLKWKTKVSNVSNNSPPPNSVIIGNDKTIYLGTYEGIIALDSDGKEKWTARYSSVQGPALSSDGSRLYFSGQNFVGAIDAKNGTEIWKYQIGEATPFGPIIGPDGTIYQGSWNHYFYAINPDGTLKWKYQTAGCISYPASIDENGYIYLGGGDAHCGGDSNLYSFSSDGNLRWKYDTGELRVGTPAIGSDGLIYVAAAPDLFVLDSSGNLNWKKGPEISYKGTAPAPNTNASCGAPPLPPCSAMGQPPQNGNTFVQPSGNGDLAGIITPAISSDGTIYVGNAQGILSAVDSKTQEIKWTYETGADPNQPGFYGLPSFPVVDKEGTVYFGSVDGKMYAVDKNGKLLWKYQTGGKITEASPAFGSDGTIYFTSEDGYLYAMTL